MRIIAGRFKKRNLVSIKDSKNLRPTSDFVREAIFDIIGEYINNKFFLDLYSGSGAVSLEALSRGAKKIFLVEKNRKNVNIIKRNLKEFNIPESEYEIFQKDCLKFLQQNKENIFFDIVFADPPYNKGYLNKLLLYLKDFNFFLKDNLIILECFKEEKFDLPECFNFLKEKKYGETKVIFLKKIL
jgi:16S rRNA (guanine966-N2)-methyltransferase